MTDAERIAELEATIATLRSEHLADAFLRHAEALTAVREVHQAWLADHATIAWSISAMLEIGRVLKKLEDG